MIKIYYFTSTGNSLWSAKKIAQIIKTSLPEDVCELYNIGALAQSAASQKTDIVVEADAVVIVYPSYAYGLPLAVSRFLKNAVFKTPYAASFVTYGSSPLGTQGALRRLLKKKGIGKMFFGDIPAVENYLAMFGPPKAETVKRRDEMQERATVEAARAVIERRENRVCNFYPFSALVSWLFSLGVKLFYKSYRVGDKCSGCAVCEKVCPVSAIVMENSRPRFTSKCEHCQGCVNLCPLRAIQFGRVKFNTPGYKHSGIELGELMANNNAAACCFCL